VPAKKSSKKKVSESSKLSKVSREESANQKIMHAEVINNSLHPDSNFFILVWGTKNLWVNFLSGLWE
jgi:hypothetical protein